MNLAKLLIIFLFSACSVQAAEYTYTVRKEPLHHTAMPYVYVKNTKGKFYTPDRYTCRMRNEKKYCVNRRGRAIDGQIVTTDENTVAYETYNDGYQSGETLIYTLDGTLLQRAEYKKGVKNGEEITYYVNGNVFIISHYKNGALNGTVSEYDINGHKVGGFDYKNGWFKGGYCKNERHNFSMKERLAQTQYNEIIPCQSEEAD